MSFQLGDVLGVQVWSHRHNWNGKVCDNAASWACGAKLEFREEYCAHLLNRCDVLSTFAEEEPHFRVHHTRLQISNPAEALKDQLLWLYGRDFREPSGTPMRPEYIVFGVYRVRSVEDFGGGLYDIRPHADGWTRFASLRHKTPRHEQTGVGSLLRIEQGAARRALVEAGEAARITPTFPEGDRQRLQRFIAGFEDWLKVAGKRAPLLVQAMGAGSLPNQEGEFSNRPLQMLGQIRPAKDIRSTGVQRTRTPIVAPAALVTEKTSPVEVVRSAESPSLYITPEARAKIAAAYGEAVLIRVLVGALTKPILILRGSPGVGKSHLASLLIADEARRRIVAVASTWRGREDLIGYINPVNNEFEPTEFTRFLIGAATAWDAGDRSVRLVILEEFNLSPPEYWLSDILVRSQYPDDARLERMVELGGAAVRGMPGAGPSVFLPPSLRFVATLNNDHTTRPLSPRVLDRACTVDIPSDPGRAIALAQLVLTEPQVEAIKNLDYELRDKNATFSLRTARSLGQCFAHGQALNITGWAAIDVVLVQEVLSKVRLLAGDPADAQVIERLATWIQAHGEHLRLCAERVSDWSKALEAGRDVL
jgi:hypothetical protein